MFSNPTDATSFHQSIILSEGKGTEEQDGELQCVINWAALLLSVRSRSASHHFTWWPTLLTSTETFSSSYLLPTCLFLLYFFSFILKKFEWCITVSGNDLCRILQHQGAQKRAEHLMVLLGRSSAPTAFWTFPKLDLWTIIISGDKNLVFISCFARCICVSFDEIDVHCFYKLLMSTNCVCFTKACFFFPSSAYNSWL